jgi:hypothetical protein
VVLPALSVVVVPMVLPEPSFMVSVLDPVMVKVPDIVAQVFDAFFIVALIAIVASNVAISFTPLE